MSNHVVIAAVLAIESLTPLEIGTPDPEADSPDVDPDTESMDPERALWVILHGLVKDLTILKQTLDEIVPLPGIHTAHDNIGAQPAGLAHERARQSLVDSQC